MGNIPSSVKTAGVLALAVAAYFTIGTILRGGDGSDTVITEEKPLFIVNTDEVLPGAIGQVISMRGNTEASRAVMVRAETPGQVRMTPAREGSRVERGDVLCEISIETRTATIAEAEAALERAKIDYDAAVALAEQGFQSNAAVAAARAALDLSEANLQRARTDLGKTRVRAPFDGVLQEQIAEPGDFLATGGACAIVANLDTLKITGALSEQDVAQLRLDNPAEINLTTGETMKAKVTFISPSAAAATRTFTIELEGENPGGIPAGVTATAAIATGNANAYNIPRNALVLGDNGTPGIRHIVGLDGSTGTVAFTPVEIVGDDAQGLWVRGPQGPVTLVVRGQEFIKQGQTVATEPSTAPGD